MTKRKFTSLWIARTGLLLAILIILQMFTKPAGQLVTGTCVNAVLAVSVVMVGLSGSMCISVISPFLAFVLGIGPKIFPITPVIALGNVVYVLLITLLFGKEKKHIWKFELSVVIASVAKFLVLYTLVVQVICRIMQLKQPQINMLSTMFSFPQLITALIGGLIAVPFFRRKIK